MTEPTTIDCDAEGTDLEIEELLDHGMDVCDACRSYGGDSHN